MIYFVTENSDTMNIILSEFMALEDVVTVSRTFDINSKFLQAVTKFCFSEKVNAKINIPFKFLWENKYTLSRCLKENVDEDGHILIMDSMLSKYSVNYIKKLQKKYKVSLLMFNPLSDLKRRKIYYYFDKILFHKVITFEDNVVINTQNIIHSKSLYSKYDKYVEKKLGSPKVFFCGMNKGRINILHNIYKQLKEGNIETLFYIDGVKEEEKLYDNKDIHYNERLSYPEYLEKVSESTCLLEILQEGQKGTTLRGYEAIVYNKQLITTNKEIINSEYFNDAYIQILDDTYNIDMDKLKNINIDYNYTNTFSSKGLYNQVLK